ncbi:hypothetical protein Hanom_Chr08g00726771 [Helianthus anomalus]
MYYFTTLMQTNNFEILIIRKRFKPADPTVLFFCFQNCSWRLGSWSHNFHQNRFRSVIFQFPFLYNSSKFSLDLQRLPLKHENNKKK